MKKANYEILWYMRWEVRPLIKVYPGQRAGGTEADMMAANELSAHASLQVNCSMLHIYTKAKHVMRY